MPVGEYIIFENMENIGKTYIANKNYAVLLSFRATESP